MVTVERPKRRSDDPRDLRDRYNELCYALTQSAGTNSAAADRLLTELQSLAQQIAAAHAQAEAEAAQAEAPKQPEPSSCCTYRSSNVVAFRLKVKASSSENPRLPAALSALTESYTPPPARAAESAPSRARTPLAALELSPPAPPLTPVEPPSPPSAATPSASAPAVETPPAAAPAAPAPVVTPPVEPPLATSLSPAAALMPTGLDGMVERQGNEIEQLAQNVESAKQLLDLLEDRLAGNPSAQGLAPDVAALRSATARQGQQLVALATAVHRLAKLLAAGAPPPAR